MYSHDPRIKDLPCEPDDLVRVYRSMNMVKISLDDHTSEPCETYVVTSRAPGTAVGPDAPLQTHIVFYLEAPAVRAVYSYSGNPFPRGKRIEAESEAADMVEQMGAILEDTGWESLSPTARVQWLSQEYLFRLGEKRPRPGASATPRPGASATPRPEPAPAATETAREVTGLETDFDALLDSAFFEGGAKPAASVAAVVAPPAPAAAPIEGPRPTPVAVAAPPAPAATPGGNTQARRACKFLAGF